MSSSATPGDGFRKSRVTPYITIFPPSPRCNTQRFGRGLASGINCAGVLIPEPNNLIISDGISHGPGSSDEPQSSNVACDQCGAICGILSAPRIYPDRQRAAPLRQVRVPGGRNIFSARVLNRGPLADSGLLRVRGSGCDLQTI